MGTEARGLGTLSYATINDLRTYTLFETNYATINDLRTLIEKNIVEVGKNQK